MEWLITWNINVEMEKVCIFTTRCLKQWQQLQIWSHNIIRKIHEKNTMPTNLLWFNRMYSLHALPLESVNLLVDIVWLVIVIYLSSTCLHINSIENVIILDNQHQFYSNINCSSHFKANTYWIGALTQLEHTRQKKKPN